MPNERPLAAAFETHRGHLFGLCYRMLGTVEDAEDVVQLAFERALERPPADTTRSWKPWLVRVAMNLARDTLRRRRRGSYVGPWLPAPIEDDRELGMLLVEDAPGPEARLSMLESATFAFLIALEELTPNQRAVVLLRDVYDLSTAEVAETLELSESNVKVTLHRARKRLDEHDGPPAVVDPARRAATEAMLVQFLSAVGTGDYATLPELLAENARLISDGGGEYAAAINVLHGPDRIIRFYEGLARKGYPALRFELRSYNGMPAVAVEYEPTNARFAPRILFRIELDDEGRIAQVQSVQTTAKLRAVRPIDDDP